MIRWVEGPSTYASCSTVSMGIYRWPWQPTMPGRMQSTAIRRFLHSMKPGNTSGRSADTTADSWSGMASSWSVRSADTALQSQQRTPRFLRYLPTNDFPVRKPTVQLPPGTLCLRKIGPVMGSDAVLSPQCRFRNTLGNLYHVFHFQRCPTCKRLAHELSPP